MTQLGYLLYDEQEANIIRVSLKDTIKFFEGQMSEVLNKDMSDTDLEIYNSSAEMVSRCSLILRKLK